MKLLIVDDHAVNLQVLRAQLGAEGNTILQPTDSPETLRALLDALRERVERCEQSPVDIAEQNRNPQAHVGERTAVLDAANRDLQAFAHSVSHDLRAPLRAIGGFTEILLRDHEEQFRPDAVHLLERVVANVKRMNRLIDELLEFSRVGSRTLNVQSIDVARLVRECLDELEVEREGAAQVTVGELPACRADLILLKQALINLLANAFKYSHRRDPARIDIGGEVRDGEFIYHVRDNGVGFDMRMAHKLFQVFQRLHAQRDFDGTGMGLAIVRRVIERHGGRVWAESAPDAGAAFYFSLPSGGPPEAVVC